MMKWQIVSGLISALVLFSCHKQESPISALFENAQPESFSQVVRVKGNDVDPESISYAYLTGPEDNLRLYKMGCPHPVLGEDSVGLKKMLSAFGYELGTDSPPLLLDSSNNEHQALLEQWLWGSQPVLKCRYPDGVINLRSVAFPEPENETKYFISFPERRAGDGQVIMYNLGCEGLISGLGLDKGRAAVVSYDSLKTDYDSSDVYDISCISGTKPSATTSFVNSCKLAKTSGDAKRWKAFKVLLDITGIKESSLTACADVETKLGELTKIDLSSRGVSDIFPLSYFPQITELNLSLNKISDFNALAKLTNLKSLVIDDNALTSVDGLAEALKDSTFLETLSLKSNNLTTAQGLEKIDGLTELDLGFNRSLQDIKSLKTLKRLKILKIKATKVMDLSSLEGLSNLSTLDVSELLGLNFLTFEPLKTTSIKSGNLIAADTFLTWSPLRQSAFTNCLLFEKIPEGADKLAIKTELEKQGQVFVEGKPTLSCQNLSIEKENIWTRDLLSDNGRDGGTAADGICNGMEECVYIDNFGRYWKGWDKVNRTFNEAVSYCQNLAFGGYNDWMLPSEDDLQTALKNNIWSLHSSSFQVFGSWSTDSGADGQSRFVMLNQGGKVINVKKVAKSPYLLCVRN